VFVSDGQARRVAVLGKSGEFVSETSLPPARASAENAFCLDDGTFITIGGLPKTFDATGKLLGCLVIPASESKEKATRVVYFGRNEVFVSRFDDDGARHYTACPLVPKK